MPYISKSALQKLKAVRRENRALRRSLKALEREATTDELTGLYRRPVFDRTLERECARRARAIDRAGCVEPITLLFIDIDHFKQVNDQHGHQIGDTVLAAVAQVIRSCLRTYDLAVRWGGEEIVVLLPATDTEGAMHLADRIRQSVMDLEIRASEMRPVPVTVSVGVASAATSQVKSDELTRELISRADSALYQAKREGRNRVVVGVASHAAIAHAAA